MLYEFEFESGFTLSPQLHYDFSHEDALVFGLRWGARSRLVYFRFPNMAKISVSVLPAVLAQVRQADRRVAMTVRVLPSRPMPAKASRCPDRQLRQVPRPEKAGGKSCHWECGRPPTQRNARLQQEPQFKQQN